MAKMCGCGGQCGSETCPRYQSQASLTDQLRELQGIANRHGLYDAADFIARSLSSASRLDA